MFLKEYTIDTEHCRFSKSGKEHRYVRKKRIALFRCDNCNSEFERPRGSMDPKRLNNNYFHVCDQCDAKRFAQKRGVERKKVWELTASSDLPIGKL
jgi:hypothetical protein